jgi:hypothetical protein
MKGWLGCEVAFGFILKLRGWSGVEKRAQTVLVRLLREEEVAGFALEAYRSLYCSR